MPPYEFSSYRSPYTETIASLLERPGQIAARAGQQKAQAWGQALEQIGQTVGNIPGQIQQAKTSEMQQAHLKAQALEDTAQAQERIQATAQREALLKAQQTIDGLMKSSIETDPTSGLTTYNRSKLQQGMTESGLGHLWPQYSEALDKADASIAKLHDAHASAIQHVATLVDLAGNDPVVFTNEIQRGIQNRLFTEQEVAPYLAQAERDPQSIAKITTLLMNKKTELHNVSPGETVLGADGKPVFTAPPAAPPAVNPETARHNKALEDQAAANATEAARHNKRLEDITAARGSNAPTRKMTSGDAGKVAEFRSALDQLATLRTTITETAHATGTAAAVGAALPSFVTDATGVGADAKKRQGVINLTKQIIGKALEGGVLRKEDEVKYEKILPTMKDPEDVAESKLAGLETAVRAKQNTFLESLAEAGYDTTATQAGTDARMPQASTNNPDLSGLTHGRKRQFRTGPFQGQIWTVDPAGQPHRVN